MQGHIQSLQLDSFVAERHYLLLAVLLEVKGGRYGYHVSTTQAPRLSEMCET